jgi:hypothetical protein
MTAGLLAAVINLQALHIYNGLLDGLLSYLRSDMFDGCTFHLSTFHQETFYEVEE